jgi:hypothetical protein
MTTDTDDTHDAPTPDEIALPVFEDALWGALRAEHATLTSSTSPADDVEVPAAIVDPDPLVDPTALPVGRRRTGRRVLAAAAAVAVLAGIGVVATTRGDDGGTTVAGPSTEAPTTTEPLTIEAQIAATLDPIVDSSVSVESAYEDGVLVSRRWTDSLSWATRTVWYDSAGNLTGDSGMASAPTGEMPPQDGVWVDHCRREWGTTRIGFRMSSDLAVVAGDIGRAIFADGHEVLDDERGIDPDDIRPDQLERRITYLVDPETLLPVATRVAAGDGFVGSFVRIEIEPRTAETLGGLVVTAPEGYEEVPPPADDSFSNPFRGAEAC